MNLGVARFASLQKSVSSINQAATETNRSMRSQFSWKLSFFLLSRRERRGVLSLLTMLMHTKSEIFFFSLLAEMEKICAMSNSIDGLAFDEK